MLLSGEFIFFQTAQVREAGLSPAFIRGLVHSKGGGRILSGSCVYIPQDLVKKQLVRMSSISEKCPHLLGKVMAGREEGSCSPHAASFNPRQPMHMCREPSHKRPTH